jgi:hypothetical protein
VKSVGNQFMAIRATFEVACLISRVTRRRLP